MAESKDKTHTFKAFITNLEMYNDGILFGEWLFFPTSTKEIREVFEILLSLDYLLVLSLIQT